VQWARIRLQSILGVGILLFTSQAQAIFEFDSRGSETVDQTATVDGAPKAMAAPAGAALLAAPALVPGPLDGFDSFEAPSSGNTIIHTPTPGTEQVWNGPWQNVSSYDRNSSDSKFLTSTEQHYDGAQSVRLTESSTPSGGFIEANRPTDNAATHLADSRIHGVSYAGYTIETYVYMPANVINANAKVYFAAYTTSVLGGTQSASLSTGVSGNSVNWLVWDGSIGDYRDTGVAATGYANTWTRLTLDLDMTAKTYTAYLNGVEVLSGASLSFGSGSSTNLYGVGYALNNSAQDSRSVYFDALLVRPKSKVPEAPSWLALVGFLGAGLLPIGWRRLRS
jgi:hypothetical protein